MTYREDYKAALENPEKFWAKTSTELLEWSRLFTKIYSGELGNDRWFEDGELNACYNCVDRWVKVHPEKIALIFNNNNGETVRFTYKEVLSKVYEVCHVLKELSPGDCVTMYLSMSPQAVFAALACARLGIIHNFVFGGFEAKTLRARIENSHSKMLISQDFFRRGRKIMNLLPTIDDAVKGLNIRVLIFDYKNITLSIKTHTSILDDPMDRQQQLNKSISISENLTEDSYGDENIVSDDSFDMPYNKNYMKWSEINHSQAEIPPVDVPSEHPLFYLYTSGSTGSPKGLVHTTGGYLTYVAYSLSIAFNIKRESDVFCCTADIGWITGHSYSVYGPLALGITSVIMEGLPSFPSHYRFFDLISQYKITQLYTAPTVVRLLKAHFDKNEFDTSPYDLSSIRYLGSVGEPINSEAYNWFTENFGCKQIIDTYFQTETGGILIAPIPNAGCAKPPPECAGHPIPGIVPFVDIEGGVKNTSGVTGFNIGEHSRLGRVYIKRSWPGITRGILDDHARFVATYFPSSGESGKGYYFTGDMGCIDSESLVWIRGRADDEINVSGHRISTAEVESAACKSPSVTEAAVVALPHRIKGQCMWLFVVLKEDSSSFVEGISDLIRNLIGGFAVPDRIVHCSAVPKTATGKIMRRVIRAIVTRQDTRDLSTCTNPESILQLKSLCEVQGLYVTQ